MAVNRNRKMIKVFATTIDLEGITLNKALERIQEYVADYGDTAFIDTYQYSYDDTEYLAIYQRRLETDEEMATRIADDEKWERQSGEQDRADYERLKAKFG
jgi:hypothetical protein